jgi:hypothetical protein
LTTGASVITISPSSSDDSLDDSSELPPEDVACLITGGLESSSDDSESASDVEEATFIVVEGTTFDERPFWCTPWSISLEESEPESESEDSDDAAVSVLRGTDFFIALEVTTFEATFLEGGSTLSSESEDEEAVFLGSTFLLGLATRGAAFEVTLVTWEALGFSSSEDEYSLLSSE